MEVLWGVLIETWEKGLIFFFSGRKNLRFWSLEKKEEILCRSINSRVNRSRENYFSLEDLKDFFSFFFFLLG